MIPTSCRQAQCPCFQRALSRRHGCSCLPANPAMPSAYLRRYPADTSRCRRPCFTMVVRVRPAKATVLLASSVERVRRLGQSVRPGGIDAFGVFQPRWRVPPRRLATGRVRSTRRLLHLGGAGSSARTPVLAAISPGERPVTNGQDQMPYIRRRPTPRSISP